MVLTINDLLEFIRAVEQACPADAPRDRFGRFVGPRDTSLLQDLAKKYQIGGSFDVQEQAGKVARAMMTANGGGIIPRDSGGCAS